MVYKYTGRREWESEEVRTKHCSWSSAVMSRVRANEVSNKKIGGTALFESQSHIYISHSNTTQTLVNNASLTSQSRYPSIYE